MKRGNARGISLIELLAALAIAALLGSMALPSMHGMIQRVRLDTAVSDLFGAIDLTRSQAIARGGRVQLVPLDAGGADWAKGWVVFIDTDNDRRPGPGEEVIASHPPLPDGIVVSFQFTSNKQPYYIAYSSAGRSCSDTSSTSARWGTISLHQDRHIRRIKINMLGRARMCRPDRDGATCAGD